MAPEQTCRVFSRTCESDFGNWGDRVSFTEMEDAGGGAGTVGRDVHLEAGGM